MIKYAVRRQLSGRVFVCFLACMIPAVLPWVMRLIPVSFGVINVLVADAVIYGISVPMIVLSFVATTFVTDPMTVRVAAFFLKLNRDAENLPSPLSVCDCFGPGYLRLVLGMFLRAVRIFVWSVIPLIIGALIPGTWELVTIEGAQVIRLGDLAYVFFLLAIVANLYRSLSYTLVPYILADQPDVSAAEASRQSATIMRGRIWEMLVLELSFFGWLFLVSITFMIAGVYAYPYIEGTVAAYYIAYTEFQNPLEQKADAA